MFEPRSYPLILAMIQPEPFPGSYLHHGMSLHDIVETAHQEVMMLQQNGFDGYILQNRNDAPIKQTANIETVAFMSVLSYELKKRTPQMIQGILVNWDGVASLAVAEAAGADFIRVEHVYTGVEIGYAGMIEAQCVDILNLKKRLGSQIPIFADVQEIHYEQLGAKRIDDAAWDTVKNAFADGLFLGGKTAQDSLDIASKVRARLGNDIPLFLSGGSTVDNVAQLMEVYQGVSVGSWIKHGDMRNPIDPARAKQFIDAARNKHG